MRGWLVTNKYTPLKIKRIVGRYDRLKKDLASIGATYHTYYNSGILHELSKFYYTYDGVVLIYTNYYHKGNEVRQEFIVSWEFISAWCRSDYVEMARIAGEDRQAEEIRHQEQLLVMEHRDRFLKGGGGVKGEV
jgi:hypothetical protein